MTDDPVEPGRLDLGLLEETGSDLDAYLQVVLSIAGIDPR